MRFKVDMQIFLILPFIYIAICANAERKINSNLQPNRKCYEFVVNNSYTTDTATQKLIRFKYKKYINKPIGKLLEDLKLSYKEIHFMRTKPLHLSFVVVEYSSYIHLDIYTEKYNYLKRDLDETDSYDIWKVEDLLKEKVTKIRVRNRYGKSLKEYPRKPILPVI